MGTPSIVIRKISFLLAVALIGTLGAGTAQAGTTLALRDGATLTLPEFEVHSSNEQTVHLTFDLPALDMERYEFEDVTYQVLNIPGGQLYGAEGTPSFPGFTRYIAIPATAGVQLNVISIDEETLSGYRLLPMVEDGTQAPVIDESAYATNAFLGEETVWVGAPAILRDIRVVPLRFYPVRHNPVTGEIRVARRVELELQFTGGDSRNQKERGTIPLTPAFDKVYGDLIVNYRESGGDRDPQLAPHLGTWVIIARDNAQVETTLQPLVEWRRRMGYNVYYANTGETGTAPNSIRSWLQDAYNNWEYPPEYVTIVGDVSGTYSLGTFDDPHDYTYGGMGDHPYCQLDGDDLMPDAFVGRLSGETYDHLVTIVDKIVSYETSPRMDRDWFSRATLVGDPTSSGPTCIQIQQWLKEKLLAIGFTECDTVFTSPFVTLMRNSVNAGVSYFGYRGFWNMSGWTTSNIYSLQNTDMLPFALNLTCGTGSFYEGTSMNEAWLRAYSSTYGLIGGIGSIATATLGTHTRYNNCYYSGAAYGLYWGDSFSIGMSNYRGKIELLLCYEDYQYNDAGKFIFWNNLMGDPATEVWTGMPETLTVDYPATLPVGADHVDVTVHGLFNTPVENAWVHLILNGESRGGGYTDNNGMVELPLDASVEGIVDVVVTGHNLLPHEGSFDIAQQFVFVGQAGYQIDDDDVAPSSGNNDGTINPGETVELDVLLQNFGIGTAQDVVLTISHDDPYVMFYNDDPINYGPIYAGTVEGPPSYPPTAFRVYEGTPAGHLIRLDLEIRSSSTRDTWYAVLYLPVEGAKLEYVSHQLGGAGSLLDPGESGSMSVTLTNGGTHAAPGPIALTLVSESYSVQVTDSDASIPTDIGPGETGTNALDTFGVSSPVDCVPGLMANLRLVLRFADGVRDTVRFQMQVGAADQNDPTGPDAYGYFAYDHTDIAYDDHPVYEWINLNPSSGGPGVSVGVDDHGYNQDASITLDLPFPFTYYGETFDRATICSNGWMAMGSTYLVNYRNWYLPSAGGPRNMISPFWDNLYSQGSGGVFHWFDEENHRYIIAWDDMKNYATNSTESFEVILYDPAHYPTLTGDGEIVFQYEVLNNNDSTQMYATAGIQDAEHTTGITYSYFSDEPPTGAPFSAPLAIKFTTGRPGYSDAPVLQARSRLMLSQNTPNPMSTGTSIRFRLPAPQTIALRVFDVDGHVVRTLMSGAVPQGEHVLDWHGLDDGGRPVSAGVYFYKLETETNSVVRKMMVVH